MIYPSSSGSIVEIKNNNLSLYNIDSLFQKQFRLKTMDEWSYELFDEKVVGNKVTYGIIQGKPLSGKTPIANKMGDKLDPAYNVISKAKLTDVIKAELATEEGPFEGEVPFADIEQKVVKLINESKKSKSPQSFVFDGFLHDNDEDFLNFVDQFGVPEFIIVLNCDM